MPKNADKPGEGCRGRCVAPPVAMELRGVAPPDRRPLAEAGANHPGEDADESKLLLLERQDQSIRI